jgi:hypothetical protein
MRAASPVLPGEDGAAFRARLDAWTLDLKPHDEVDRFLVTRAVEVSWKLDRVARALEAGREAARYADAARLAAQAEEVAGLGRRLYFDPVGPLCLYPHTAPADGEVQHVSWSGNPDDPDDPARLVERLEAMTLGCAWLLDRWGELREILESGLLWQPHDRLKAVRMLGRQPLEAPDDKRVMAIYLCGWAMDPEDQYGFQDMANELGKGQRKVFVERLNSRNAMEAMPQSEEAARAELVALIVAEEERLEALLTEHLQREEAEAAAELAFDDSPWGERLRRYEALNDRILLRIIEILRKRHREADAAASPAGRASVRAESAPRETADDVEPVARERTEDPIQADLDRVVQVPGVSPLTQAGDMTDQGRFEAPGQDLVRTEPGPSCDAACVSATPAHNTTENPPIAEGNGQEGRNATNPAGGPADSGDRTSSGVVAALLASFVLFVFAGFSAAFGASRDVMRPVSAPQGQQTRVERAYFNGHLSKGWRPASPVAVCPRPGLSPPAEDCR